MLSLEKTMLSFNFSRFFLLNKEFISLTLELNTHTPKHMQTIAFKNVLKNLLFFFFITFSKADFESFKTKTKHELHVISFNEINTFND